MVIGKTLPLCAALCFQMATTANAESPTLSNVAFTGRYADGEPIKTTLSLCDKPDERISFLLSDSPIFDEIQRTANSSLTAPFNRNLKVYMTPDQTFYFTSTDQGVYGFARYADQPYRHLSSDAKCLFDLNALVQ